MEKSIMSKKIVREAGLVLDPAIIPFGESYTGMAELLYQAFHGSLDDRGETLEDWELEITNVVTGGYGPFMKEHSFIYQENGVFQGVVMTGLFRNVPLILYAAVAPDFRRQGKAGMLLNQVMRSFEATAYQEVFLVVKESNEPAKALYEQLGFKEKGSDWETVLKK